MDRAHHHAPTGMPARLIAGCMAIVTALVCALMPLGPVHTRSAGSAFDPTTSTVALSPRPERLRERSAAIAPSPDRANGGLPTVDGSAVVPTLASVRTPFFVAETTQEAARPALPLSPVLRQPRARAPPLA
jgi:hypothetical protein